MPHRGVIKSSCELHVLHTWNPKRLFLTGCFNWMMNQIFTWEMTVSTKRGCLGGTRKMAKNIQTVHECMFQIAEGADLCHANLPYPKVTLPQRKGFVNHHSLLTVSSKQSLVGGFNPSEKY